MVSLVKKIAVAFGVFCIAACNNAGEPDNYRFEKREYTNKSVTVRVVEHDSLRFLRASYKEATGKTNNNLMAWSVLQGENCTVHILKPEESFQTYYIGHEFAHCVWGEWHPEQDKTR